MLNTTTAFKIPLICLGLILLAPPALSYAWDSDHHRDHHYYRYHEHPSFGLHLSFVPDDAFVVSASGARYYFYDGLYYTRIGGDFVLVAPPIGAVVTAIPPEYRPVIINGITYYTDNGVYYIYTRYGYQVVPQPVTVVVQAPVVVTQSAPAAAIVPVPPTPPQPVSATSSVQVTLPAATPAADDIFTVNIPNNKGGYTPVTIKKSGEGFVGPQGEFYAEFPKVAQLQVMYGK